MGLPNLSGSLIQETYQRILHIGDDGVIYNGSGSNATVLTQKGNFSSSGVVSGLTGSFPHIVTTGGTIEFVENFANKNRIGSIKYDVNNGFELRNQADDGRQKLKISELSTEHIAATTTITSSGLMTASGNIYAAEFHGDGSNLTGVTAEWDGSHNGNAVITGSLTTTAGVSTNAITASGIISASGVVTAYRLSADSELTLNGDTTVEHDGTTIAIGSSNRETTIIGSPIKLSSNRIELGQSATQHVTASGHISASGNIYFESIEGGTF